MSLISSFESQLGNSDSPTAAKDPSRILDALEQTLLAEKDYHRLFDAQLMRARVQLGLPVTQPTSFTGVPTQMEPEFRECYVKAARHVGQLFLAEGRLADAWAYFRTIGEPQPIRDAIEKIEIPEQSNAAFDEVLNLALYDGAHVVRGLQFLLKTHGTCNTITAMSQLMPQMTQDERRQAAALMVRNLFADLQYSIRRDVEGRGEKVPETLSVGELIAGRDFLFADGNYHIDVSHLHSTVGFARHLKSEDPELTLACQLCLYGSRLSKPLQYPADVPFDDYYVCSQHFLNAIAGNGVDAAMQYLTDRLNQEPDAQDQRLIAFVIVDLGQRVGQIDRALEVAGSFVSRMEDPAGFSFSTFCVQSGRIDILEQNARQNDDILSLATALLSQPHSTAG